MESGAAPFSLSLSGDGGVVPPFVHLPSVLMEGLRGTVPQLWGAPGDVCTAFLGHTEEQPCQGHAAARGRPELGPSSPGLPLGPPLFLQEGGRGLASVNWSSPFPVEIALPFLRHFTV